MQKSSVKGFIAPIEYTQYNFHVAWNELANLRIAEPEKQYSTAVFQAFLPSESVSVGECWQIQEEGVLTLLQQLHPNPRLKLTIDSGDSRGLWGCLRAYNDGLAEIVFRIHAEFIMESGKFTPSQFAGYLLIDRIQEKIVSFKMYVPPTTLNFDAGWTQEDGGTFAENRLLSTDGTLRGYTIGRMSNSQRQLRKQKPNARLSSRFYKFQEINWVSLEEALGGDGTRTTETDPCYLNRWTALRRRGVLREWQGPEGR